MKRFFVFVLVVMLVILAAVPLPQVGASESYWIKTYGGNENETLYDLQPAPDGYIGIGITGIADTPFLIKLKNNGNIAWVKTIATNSNDTIVLWELQQISDGYIIGGAIGSGDDQDILIVKLDTEGKMIWSRIIGGNKKDLLMTLQQISDGYIIGGAIGSGDEQDILIVKLDTEGKMIWSRIIGGNKREGLFSLKQTLDGYVGIGYTESFGVGGRDFLIIKFDLDGNVMWSKTVGGAGNEYFAPDRDIQITLDGGIVLAGYTFSFEWKLGNPGVSRHFVNSMVMRLNSQGNIIWSKLIGATTGDFMLNSIRESSKGYIIGGTYLSYVNGLVRSLVFIELDSQGTVIWCKTFGEIPLNDDLLITAIREVRGIFIGGGYGLISRDSEEDIDNDIIAMKIDFVLMTNCFKDLDVSSDVQLKDVMFSVNQVTLPLVSYLITDQEYKFKLVSSDVLFQTNTICEVIPPDTTPPELNIISPQDNTSTSQNKILVKGVVTDDEAGVKSCLVNNVSVPVSLNGTFEKEITLIPGKNTIEIQAEDNAGNIASKTITVIYIEKKTIILKLQIGKNIMYVDDKVVFLDVSPIIIENRTLLPIRWIAEPLGAQVSWNSTEKKVIVTLKDTTIELWIGKSIAKVNGIDTPIDSNNPKVVPVIINSRTMLPLRFIAESLGCDVQWDNTTKTVTITYPKS